MSKIASIDCNSQRNEPGDWSLATSIIICNNCLVNIVIVGQQKNMLLLWEEMWKTIVRLWYGVHGFSNEVTTNWFVNSLCAPQACATDRQIAIVFSFSPNGNWFWCAQTHGPNTTRLVEPKLVTWFRFKHKNKTITNTPHWYIFGCSSILVSNFHVWPLPGWNKWGRHRLQKYWYYYIQPAHIHPKQQKKKIATPIWCGLFIGYELWASDTKHWAGKKTKVHGTETSTSKYLVFIDETKLDHFQQWPFSLTFIVAIVYVHRVNLFAKAEFCFFFYKRFDFFHKQFKTVAYFLNQIEICSSDEAFMM